MLFIDNPLMLQAIMDEQRGFHNGMLFLDDFRNRMAMHSFKKMNLQIMQFEPELFIFRTRLPPNDAVEGRVARWQDLVRTADRVNDRARADRFYFEHFNPA